MGSKKVIKKTKYGNILSLKRGEEIASLARRQQKEFNKNIKKRKL